MRRGDPDARWWHQFAVAAAIVAASTAGWLFYDTFWRQTW